MKSPAFREPEKAIDPVDSFTINIEELDRIKSSLHQYFTHMMHAHLPKGGPNTHTYQTPPLNAANLQHQQEALNKERAASVKNNNSNRAPAAPTTSHAPFLFGSQSPQGVPHFFGGKNELTQEKLVLPVAKKRKGNNQGASAASTPAQAQATPATKSSPLPKADPPGSQCTAAAPTIKCSVPGCETGRIGFASKADLDKHVVESHEPKEPVIKDPLDAAAYAIEGMRLALNLDESGKSKPIIQQPKAEPPQAQAMKKTLSAQGVKQDVSTPMSRIPTQVGPSPSSNPLRTPQTAASETKATGKDRKTVLTAAKPPVSPAADLWANSHVKPGWFKEVFSDVSHLNRPVLDDFVVDWLRRNPFTPPSSPSSGATSKDSPHKSDISANDTLNINVSTDDDVLMAELFDDTLLGDLAGLEMDWDAATEELAAKGKRRRDGEEAVASEEWLKNWAPEKYTERKRESAQRKR